MGCEWQSCGRCTPQEELFSPADADVVAARISMCRNRTWHKPDTRFALAHSMNMHGRAAAMVTPIGDKKRLFPAESAVSSSGCAGRGRVKRAARERTNGRTQGFRERSDAKVCASASVAEGPVRLCGLLSMYTSRSRPHWAWGAAPSTYTP